MKHASNIFLAVFCKSQTFGFVEKQGSLSILLYISSGALESDDRPSRPRNNLSRVEATTAEQCVLIAATPNRSDYGIVSVPDPLSPLHIVAARLFQ